MTVRTLSTIAAVVVAAALAGCGGSDGVSTPDGAWVAISGISDGADVDLVEGSDVTIAFDGDRVAGTAACNGYGGSVALGDDGTFTAADLSWTEIGCEPTVMAVEQAYLTSLTRFTEYQLAAGLLTLRSGTDEWVFTEDAGAGD